MVFENKSDAEEKLSPLMVSHKHKIRKYN